MNKQPIFLTDGKGGIYKIEKLIKAAILINLETKQTVTSEIIGSNITGFAIIEMPKIKDAPVDLPKIADGSPKKIKSKKGRKNKSSQYFGVAAGKGKKPWRTSIWLDGKNVSTGSYDSEIEAARAVDTELEKRGKPKRNFP